MGNYIYWLTFFGAYLVDEELCKQSSDISQSRIDRLNKTAFFNGPTAFGFKFKEYYVSSHPDRTEPELTMSIVALGATAVSSFFEN